MLSNDKHNPEEEDPLIRMFLIWKQAGGEALLKALEKQGVNENGKEGDKANTNETG